LSRRLLENHELLGPDFRRGLADGVTLEPQNTEACLSSAPAVDETVWALLVQGPFREEAPD